MEKCSRLHEFPSKPAGKGRGVPYQNQNRKLNNTWIESESQETVVDTQVPLMPRLNAEQSKQLFQFLSNLTGSNSSQNQQKAGDQENIVANMAGILQSCSPIVYNSNVVCYSCKLDSDCWVLDSGASDHMSFDSKTLHDLCLLAKPILVSLPNGYKVQVTHNGKLKLNDYIELDHVLLVPHFTYTLLSVKRLTSQLHCTVVFSEDLCTLRGSSLKRPLDIGRETLGLYILDKSLLKGV